jgi:hypothetical protein
MDKKPLTWKRLFWEPATLGTIFVLLSLVIKWLT